MYKTKIEFCDSSHAFWSGCLKVSDGCKFCWMHRSFEKKGTNPSIITKANDYYFKGPIYWSQPRKIFTCHTSDFFIKEADEWREEAWNVIRRCPQHTWQIITKRPERILKCLPEDWGENGYDNVWLGVTVENQEQFKRVEILSKIPAKIRFIISEPILEKIDFLIEKDGERLIDNFKWVILGGESGNEYGRYRYRPSEIEWYESAIKQLRENSKVAIFVKQLGAYLRNKLGLKEWFGANMEEWPNHLRIREFPE